MLDRIFVPGFCLSFCVSFSPSLQPTRLSCWWRCRWRQPVNPVMCARILHARPVPGVGAHGLLGRTWGSREAQDVTRSRPETFVLVQDAEMFARRTEGLAFTDPLRFG